MVKKINISDTLITKLQINGKRSSSAQTRITNINWIKDLPRKSLFYEKKEKQLLMHTTKIGEKIYIQYPGKESQELTRNGKERKESAIRPWDFRPELYLPDNSRHKKMSFGDIWAIIFEAAEKISQKKAKKVLRILATLLYRMAFMLDHVKIEKFNSLERYVVFKNNGESGILAKKKVELTSFYKYSPDNNVLDYIASIYPNWGAMSFEAFLYYNDLLGWNEDCKYYYRNYYAIGNEEWLGGTGRINTLCTHIRILGAILKDVELAAIFNDFSKQKGVSPASANEILKICKDYIIN